MKFLILITFLLLLMPMKIVAQSKHVESVSTVEKYRKMKKTGQITTLVSVFSALAGGMMMYSTFWEYGPPGESGPYVIGEVMVVAGTIGMVTGITLWARGGKKKKEFEPKLETLYIRPAIQATGTGLTLSYRF